MPAPRAATEQAAEGSFRHRDSLRQAAPLRNAGAWSIGVLPFRPESHTMATALLKYAAGWSKRIHAGARDDAAPITCRTILPDGPPDVNRGGDEKNGYEIVLLHELRFIDAQANH